MSKHFNARVVAGWEDPAEAPIMCNVEKRPEGCDSEELEVSSSSSGEILDVTAKKGNLKDDRAHEGADDEEEPKKETTQKTKTKSEGKSQGKKKLTDTEQMMEAFLVTERLSAKRERAKERERVKTKEMELRLEERPQAGRNMMEVFLPGIFSPFSWVLAFETKERQKIGFLPLF